MKSTALCYRPIHHCHKEMPRIWQDQLQKYWLTLILGRMVMVGWGMQKTLLLSMLKVCILCHQSYPYFRNVPASQPDATAFNNKICTHRRAAHVQELRDSTSSWNMTWLQWVMLSLPLSWTTAWWQWQRLQLLGNSKSHRNWSWQFHALNHCGSLYKWLSRSQGERFIGHPAKRATLEAKEHCKLHHFSGMVGRRLFQMLSLSKKKKAASEAFLLH